MWYTSVMSKEQKREPQDWREGRRLRALELHQAGWKQGEIARALGVSDGAVSQWLKRAREGGVEALYRQVAAGPSRKLTEAQRAQLPELLAKGAEHYGFRGEVWTLERVAEVIRREFGVSYHWAHVGRILKGIGWSRQKPIKRASQRDEAAIQQWREQRWDALKKKLPRKDEPSSV